MATCGMETTCFSWLILITVAVIFFALGYATRFFYQLIQIKKFEKENFTSEGEYQ